MASVPVPRAACDVDEGTSHQGRRRVFRAGIVDSSMSCQSSSHGYLSRVVSTEGNAGGGNEDGNFVCGC